MNSDSQQQPRAVVEGFDELTAQQLRRQLDFLTERELRVLRLYESAHKRRRTLLRAIDARLRDDCH